jgi:hypothetical protein
MCQQRKEGLSSEYSEGNVVHSTIRTYRPTNLASMGYTLIDNNLLWDIKRRCIPETFRFYLQIREITMTLD